MKTALLLSVALLATILLSASPSPRDGLVSRMLPLGSALADDGDCVGVNLDPIVVSVEPMNCIPPILTGHP